MEISANRSILDSDTYPILIERLKKVCQDHGPWLIVCDVDSTFIQQEVIDLLASFAGKGREVSQITERAMKGELDFASSLQERVATLAGLPIRILDNIQSEIALTEGADHLVEVLRATGHEFALISGGFLQVLEPIATSLKIKHFHANTLEVKNDLLTGRTIGPVVDASFKAQYLQKLADSLDIDISHTLAVGDGSNDIEMMRVAGRSVSFNGKPAVIKIADVKISGPYLDHVLLTIGD